MTIRDYMKRCGGNLGWCKPYFSEDENVVLAVNEGKPCGVMIDREDIRPEYVDKPETIHRVAVRVNAYHEDYVGWDDLHVALDVMKEGDCCDCPWFGICDAMDGDVES